MPALGACPPLLVEPPKRTARCFNGSSSGSTPRRVEALARRPRTDQQRERVGLGTSRRLRHSQRVAGIFGRLGSAARLGIRAESWTHIRKSFVTPLTASGLALSRAGPARVSPSRSVLIDRDVRTRSPSKVPETHTRAVRSGECRAKVSKSASACRTSTLARMATAAMRQSISLPTVSPFR